MDVPALITAIAALVGSIGAIRTTARTNQRVVSELSPNHGGSTRDAIDRIESAVHSQGHQIGEIRRDAAMIHEDHATRLRNLERRL